MITAVQVSLAEIKITLGHILDESRKTNGRVTKHDDEIDELKRFKASSLTVVTTASAIGGGAYTFFKLLDWMLR